MSKKFFVYLLNFCLILCISSNLYKFKVNNKIYVFESNIYNKVSNNVNKVSNLNNNFEFNNTFERISNKKINYSNEEIYFMVDLLKKELKNISDENKYLEENILTETSYNNLLSEISNNKNNINNNNDLIKENSDLLNIYQDKNNKENIFLKNYPVGSVYFSEKNTNPSLLFGGEWVQIKDTFLLGTGNLSSINATNNIVSHQHSYGMEYGGYFRLVSIEENPLAGLLNYSDDTNFVLSSSEDYNTSLEAPINNSSVKTFTEIEMTHYKMIANTSKEEVLPPYLSIYIWKRVS